MAQPDIAISPDTSADIQKIIAQYEANEINEQIIQKKNEQLRAAAKEFMDVYIEAEQDIKKYNELQQSRAAARKNIAPVVTEEKYAENLRITKTTNNYSGKFKDFFNAILIFNDKILNIIYDKPVETAIVIEGNEGPLVYTFTIDELLEAGGVEFVEDYESHSHTLIGRIKIDVNKLIANNLKLKQLNNDGLTNFSISGLNKAYANAKIDLQDNTIRTGKKRTYQAFYKSDYTNWIWRKIFVGGGFGDLAEAYSYFYLKQTTAFNEGPWPNLTLFFELGVAQVDNISGLLTTDVETEEINYAIKASKASLPGYKQMIKLATDILADSSKSVDIEKLVKKAYQAQFKGTGANAIQKGLRNTIEEAPAFKGIINGNFD